MKMKDAVAEGTDRVMNFVLDEIEEERADVRSRLYRKIGLNLIKLSVRMEIEREYDDHSF